MALITPSRDAYLTRALPAIPALLQLLDRDPTSRTYGCFDRQYWHYRTMDFPCGMNQEFVLPLAIVWKHGFPGSSWQGAQRLREFVLAGIDFARRSAHRDGSCDDYYPFERALGAAVFSLYAMAEAYRLVGADDPKLLAFLVQRADWVATKDESGVLTNHHAIAAAALEAVYALSQEARHREAALAKAQEVLHHQHEEGWFREYEGFDPGYQTVTIDFLARYQALSGDESVLPGLGRALDLLERVQMPDGLFGGEYAARNTWHTQPHGFELLAERFPAAGRIADRYLVALEAGREPVVEDERLRAHWVYPRLLAWLAWRPRTAPTEALPKAERITLEACGFHIDRRADRFLIAGLRKGAPFRAYAGTALLANDSGPVVVLEDGRRLVPHVSHGATFVEDQGGVVVRGRLRFAKGELMSTPKSVLLRVVMLTVGRVARTFVRKLLQRRLILGAKEGPIAFERRIEALPRGWKITDTLRAEGPVAVRSVHLGVGQTSIYIAASQPWQEGWLLPWTDLSGRRGELASPDGLRVERTIQG